MNPKDQPVCRQIWASQVSRSGPMGQLSVRLEDQPEGLFQICPGLLQRSSLSIDAWNLFDVGHVPSIPLLEDRGKFSLHPLHLFLTAPRDTQADLASTVAGVGECVNSSAGSGQVGSTRSPRAFSDPCLLPPWGAGREVRVEAQRRFRVRGSRKPFNGVPAEGTPGPP
jgi:hypothetical protein